MSAFSFINETGPSGATAQPATGVPASSSADDLFDELEPSAIFSAPPPGVKPRGSEDTFGSFFPNFFGGREASRNGGGGTQRGYEKIVQSNAAPTRRTSSPAPRSTGSVAGGGRSYSSDPAGPTSLPNAIGWSPFDFINGGGGSKKQQHQQRSEPLASPGSAFSFIETPQPQATLGDLAFALTPTPAQSSKLGASIILTSPPRSPALRPGTSDVRRLQSETRLKQTRAELTRLLEYHSRAHTRRDAAREAISATWMRAREAAKDAAEAIEREDYAQAATGQARGEEARAHIERCEGMIPDLERAVDDAAERVVEMMKRGAEGARGVAAECRALKEDRERSLHQFESDAQHENDERASRLEAEREEMERARSDAVFNLEMWERADAEFQDKVDEVVHDELAEKEMWITKREGVKKEIEDLLARLTHLRTEEKEHTRRVDELDARIRNMTAGMAGERDELVREKEAIMKRMEEIDARVAHANDLDRDLHRTVEHQQQDKDRRWAEIDSLSARARELAGEADEADQEAEEVRAVRAKLRGVEEEVARKEGEVAEARTAADESDRAVQKLTAKLLQEQQAFADLERDIAAIEAQMPGVEEQKKLAIASRDFKTAGQCSTRLKQMSATLEDRRAALARRRPKVEEARARVEEARTEAGKRAERMREMEERIGFEIHRTLATLLADLEAQRLAASERGRAALEAVVGGEVEGIRKRMELARVRYELEEKGETKVLIEVGEEVPRALARDSDDDYWEKRTSVQEQEGTGDLEQILQEAIEREDFELAESIQQEIEKLQTGL